MKRTNLVLAMVAFSWTFAACALAAEETEPLVQQVAEVEAVEADAIPAEAQAVEVRLELPAAGVPVYVPPNRGTAAHRIGGGTRGGELGS